MRTRKFQVYQLLRFDLQRCILQHNTIVINFYLFQTDLKIFVNRLNSVETVVPYEYHR